jgi:hypothetical protein
MSHGGEHLHDEPHAFQGTQRYAGDTRIPVLTALTQPAWGRLVRPSRLNYETPESSGRSERPSRRISSSCSGGIGFAKR